MSKLDTEKHGYRNVCILMRRQQWCLNIKFSENLSAYFTAYIWTCHSRIRLGTTWHRWLVSWGVPACTIWRHALNGMRWSVSVVCSVTSSYVDPETKGAKWHSAIIHFNIYLCHTCQNVSEKVYTGKVYTYMRWTMNVFQTRATIAADTSY